jgi:glycosyltransferase involved in cell wall biosynthesis
MNVLIANERLLFRFGVDRVLILLGTALKKAGHNVVVLANKYDSESTDGFADKVVDIPVDTGNYLHQNEFTNTWLINNYSKVLPEFIPDIVLFAGWPFYSSIPFFNSLGAKTVYMDCGAVPLDGFNEGQTLIQTKLRELRKNYLKDLSIIVAISDFIANTQSLPDSLGQTPIVSILLAADHIKQTIEAEAKSCPNIEKIKALREDNIKLIFALGRWEPDNYKNSLASLNIINLVRYTHPNTKLIILGHEEELNIPNELKDSIIAVGFPNDDQLLELMQLSDIGIIVSKWEGFNLPLAEMQSIEKPTFVFNVAAHPEVVVHPWFLCETDEDMAKKISLVLSKNYEDILGKVNYTNFHNFFKWDRVITDYKEIFEMLLNDQHSLKKLSEKLPNNKLQAILDVSNSCLDPANPGIIRVTRRFSAEIQKKINPLFVLWDNELKEYVFPTHAEYQTLGTFNGPSIDPSLPTSEDKSRILLTEYLNEHPCKYRWLILMEIFREYESKSIINYAQKNHLKIASIFYDAIPALYPEYCNNEVKLNHTKYMSRLSECDLVLSISKYSENCLANHWNEQKIHDGEIITNDLPGEFGGAERVLTVKSRTNKINFLCVSTLEPRKNHATLLKAIDLIEKQYPALDFKLTLIGNRYAGAFEIAENIELKCQNNSKIDWLGPVSDSDLIRAYNETDFTVYPSIVEGFGMPILESIWFGKPCVCSSEGSMGGLAKSGGCLTTDILDAEKLSAAIYQLASDDKLYTQLSTEATHRKIKTWEEYTDISLGLLLSKSELSHTFSYAHDSSVDNKRILICCNAYPPHFVGGAELIAHYHALELKNKGYEVKVFAGDSQSSLSQYTLETSVYDDIEVYRIKLEPEDLSSEYVNFSHTIVQNHFEAILDDYKPSVVHMHNIIGLSVSLAPIAKSRGVKTVLTLHDSWGFCHKNTMMWSNGTFCNDFIDCSYCLAQIHDGKNRSIPLEMRQDFLSTAFESVDIFISPSIFLRNQYIKAGFDEDKIILLSNGIDINHFSKIIKQQDECIRFTFIGYLGEHKGSLLILKALKLIVRNNKIKVNIVGDGHLKDTLKDYVKDEGLNGYVDFLGKIDNKEINQIFSQTDVYILPSMCPENQPVSITEAFASKVPVIGTDFGGIKELITDNKTGLLFPMGDVGALAAKMQFFIDHPEKQIEFGEAAYKFILNNSFSNQAAKLIDLYHSFPVKKCIKKKFIVSCIGTHVSTIASQAIKTIKEEHFSINFVMHEWLEGFEAFKSDLIWVVDPYIETDKVKNLRNLQKPFLIPKKHDYFKSVCIKENNGLYYVDSDSAIECIYYIFNKKMDAYLIGENGVA